MINDLPLGQFGPFEDDVVEVLRTVYSPSFLTEVRNVPSKALIVSSVQEMKLAEPASIPSVCTNLDWNDFLEYVRSDYVTPPKDILSPHEVGEMIDRISSITRDFNSHLSAQVSWLSRDMRRNVDTLIDDCAICRAVRGKSSDFWELVFSCLKAGVIPIGWSGTWPEGRMICLRR